MNASLMTIYKNLQLHTTSNCPDHDNKYQLEARGSRDFHEIELFSMFYVNQTHLFRGAAVLRFLKVVDLALDVDLVLYVLIVEALSSRNSDIKLHKSSISLLIRQVKTQKGNIHRQNPRYITKLP